MGFGHSANCPNCGGDIVFKAGQSLLAVCPYCSSAVSRRGDDIGELELLGQVAPLAALDSPLYLGLTGRYQGKRFEVLGRIQLDWGQGPWNEWYIQYESGQNGWIAEAQGRAYVMTEGKIQPKMAALTGRKGFASLQLGQGFRDGDARWVVTEVREGRFVSGEGELPHRIIPGAVLCYADLEGENGRFATLDWGDAKTDVAPEFYAGSRCAYTDLFSADALRESALDDRFDAPKSAAHAHNCPNCGAGVDIKQPGQTKVLTCTACDAVLDCSQPDEIILDTVQRYKLEPLTIPLGSKGVFNGKTYTVYGYLRRGVEWDGGSYRWGEYLLRDEAARSYHWLIESSGHWSWSDPMSVAEISPFKPKNLRERFFRPNADKAICYQHKVFDWAASNAVQVYALRGEFYWKVSVNSWAEIVDWTAPPLGISGETTPGEYNCSLNRYLEPEEVQKAFKLKRMPERKGIGLLQPTRESYFSRIAKVASVLIVLIWAIGVLSRPSFDGIHQSLSFQSDRSENTIVSSLSWPLASKDSAGRSGYQDRIHGLPLEFDAELPKALALVKARLKTRPGSRGSSFDPGVQVEPLVLLNVRFTDAESGAEQGLTLLMEGGPENDYQVEKTIEIPSPGRYVVRVEAAWGVVTDAINRPLMLPEVEFDVVPARGSLFAGWVGFLLLIWIPAWVAMVRRYGFLRVQREEGY